MFISLFIANNSLYIYQPNRSITLNLSDQKEMADIIPIFLPKPENNLIVNLGPSSFTTTRVINSIAKGIKVAKPDVKFIGISNFLTYLFLLNKPNGNLAIPTFRGDYYVTEFKDYQLSEILCQDEEYIKKNNTYLDSEFNNYNLAYYQFLAINNCIAEKNKSFISNNIDISYNITPVFRKCNSL